MTMKLKFTQVTLNAILDDVIEAYFEDDNTMSLGECVDYVKDAYKNEIETLHEGPQWIRG